MQDINDFQDKKTREPHKWSTNIPKGEFHYPSTLAEIVSDHRRFELESGFTSPAGPDEKRMRALIEEAYHAGLATEEGKNIAFRVLYGTRGNFIRFEEPLPYQVGQIVKLAAATSISNNIAINVWYVDYSSNFPNGLKIIGIGELIPDVHKMPGRFEYLNPFLPVDLCLTSLRPGHLRLYVSGLVLELIHGKIKWLPPMGRIIPYLDWESEIVCNILSRLKQSQAKCELDIKMAFEHLWAGIIRRVREAKHGGCFLIVPSKQWDSAKQHLKLKYQCNNENEQSKILHKIALYVEQVAKYEMETEKERDNAFAQTIYSFEDCEKQAKLLSQISQVDGAVVLLNNLELKGFGAEIVVPEVPGNQQEEMIFVCNGFKHEPATAKTVREYGTRHRSAFRFCKNVPGALAFVISQDGNPRIMHSFQDKVYLWDGFTEFWYY